MCMWIKGWYSARMVEVNAVASTWWVRRQGSCLSSCLLVAGWSWPTSPWWGGGLWPIGSPEKIGWPFVWSALSSTDFWLE